MLISANRRDVHDRVRLRPTAGLIHTANMSYVHEVIAHARIRGLCSRMLGIWLGAVLHSIGPQYFGKSVARP